MKIISLFSGCGGLDLGLIQAGNTIIWANDIDKDACATYRENIGNHIICDDIKNIDVSTLPDADVVVGGFPCQGFSQANRLRTLNDDRNKLYRFFYNTILIKQPKFFIAENVKGILSLGKGSAIKQIVSDFEAAGYIISVHLVNMADYGVPQTRQRVIIVGQRIDLGKELHFRFPKPTHSKNGELLKWVSIKEAIDYFPDPNAENGVLNHIYSAYKVEFRNFTGHRKTDPDKPSPTILARGNGRKIFAGALFTFQQRGCWYLLASAQSTPLKGSPTSAALVRRLRRRAVGLRTSSFPSSTILRPLRPLRRTACAPCPRRGRSPRR